LRNGDILRVRRRDALYGLTSYKQLVQCLVNPRASSSTIQNSRCPPVIPSCPCSARYIFCSSQTLCCFQHQQKIPREKLVCPRTRLLFLLYQVGQLNWCVHPCFSLGLCILHTLLARPPTQSSSHPRLITTKLTATPQPSSTPGPGWSRPSSVTPPVSTPALNGNPTPAQSATNPPIPSAPQLPHVGKVIQPQPRSAAQASNFKDAISTTGSALNKPVWGNLRANLPRSDLTVHNDFPTAAEVAHGMFIIPASIHILNRCQVANPNFPTQRRWKWQKQASRLGWKRLIRSEACIWIQTLITGTR